MTSAAQTHSAGVCSSAGGRRVQGEEDATESGYMSINIFPAIAAPKSTKSATITIVVMCPASLSGLNMGIEEPRRRNRRQND